MRGLAWVVGAVLVPGLGHAQLARVEPSELAAALAGRVCRDVDEDGQCGAEEPGLSGVRVVLATGREVRTDAQGRYHFAEVDARTPNGTGGLHLRPGRHRVKVDRRTLPPDSEPSPEAATVEVPWAAAVLQDFAVRMRALPSGSFVLSYQKAPPAAVAVPGGVDFLVAGQATPGDRVRVSGTEAQVAADGTWRARVLLAPGENVLWLSSTSASNTVRFFLQRVELVARGSGWLVIPRAPEPRGLLRLPGRKDEPVSSGPTLLHAEFPPGTRVRWPQGELEVGPSGVVEIPLVLALGRNEVPLELLREGESVRTFQLVLEAVSQPFAVGLLDVEGTYAPGTGGFRLRGRGAAHAEARLGPVSLTGELDLRDTDVDALRGQPPSAWLRPRVAGRLDRVPDPDLAIPEWGDTSVGLTPNPAEGRLRLEARHDAYGRAGLGTYRALQAEGEVGRYHRPLFGPYAELASALGPVRAGVEAFAGGLVDPTLRLAAVPVSEEFHTTGGSLYFLGTGSVAEGSELVRVELRDGLTGLPLAERHLVRGRDYDIDYLSGRLLLARPLSLVAGEPLLRTDALGASTEPVLTVQYAALRSGGANDAVGGEAWVGWESGRVSVSAVREQRQGAPFQLLSGKARGTLGGYTLMAEVARSAGLALGTEDYGLSDDGGLTFFRPGVAPGTGGDALSVRLRGPGFSKGGSLDAAFRRRTRGFSDGTHVDTVAFRQLSLRAVQPLGPVRLTLLGDDRLEADPRRPFSEAEVGARTLGVGVGYEGEGWGVTLEARDASLSASELPGEGPLLEGGRTSVGLEGHLGSAERWRVSVGHRQSLRLYGEGPGRVDDTFSSVGVDLGLSQELRLGVRGGWGPALGPLAWVHGTWQRGPEVYYGSYSVDVDGPDVGAGRAVSGARTELADGTHLFVEDVSSHDANAVRLARAVGFQQTVFDSLRVGGRYERGVRHPLDLPSTLTRDVAGLFGQLVLPRFRADGRAELRYERGVPVRGAPVALERVQAVVMLAAEAVLRDDLTLSSRVDFSRTSHQVGLEARLLEGYAALAWRPGPLLLVARYGVQRELLPGARAAFGERTLQTFSLLPAVRLGDRFAVAAGGHLGRGSLGGASVWVFTGSLRPSVRVVGGLEVAVEGARRTTAPVGESLEALRGELGYRVDDRLRVAAGYTLLGFTGLGMTEEASDGADRLYLRAELAY